MPARPVGRGAHDELSPARNGQGRDNARPVLPPWNPLSGAKPGAELGDSLRVAMTLYCSLSNRSGKEYLTGRRRSWASRFVGFSCLLDESRAGRRRSSPRPIRTEGDLHGVRRRGQQQEGREQPRLLTEGDGRCLYEGLDAVPRDGNTVAGPRRIHERVARKQPPRAPSGSPRHSGPAGPSTTVTLRSRGGAIEATSTDARQSRARGAPANRRSPSIYQGGLTWRAHPRRPGAQYTLYLRRSASCSSALREGCRRRSASWR